MGNAVFSANAGARLVELETQIRRFNRSYRKRLRKLARQSSRLGDLMFTFPGAAFAMVSGYGTPDQRGQAIRLVRDGASLQNVAGAMDLPMWTRRLPPEAFNTPLRNLPQGERFAQRITNAVPLEVEVAGNWFAAVQDAVEAGDPDFAVWLARQPIYFAGVAQFAPVRPLAIFAWFSKRPDVRGRGLIDKPWHPKMRYGQAVEQMCLWFDRVVRDLCRADQKRGPGRYSRRRKSDGYTIVPLRTAHELWEEGEVMNHCVGSYASAVAGGECLIFSVRRGARRIATLELRWCYGRRHPPVLNQLQGPGNTPVDPAVHRAVNDWLSTQDNLMLTAPAMIGRISVDATRWKAMWGPYVAARGRKSLLGDRPDHHVLLKLCHEIEMLVDVERRA